MLDYIILGIVLIFFGSGIHASFKRGTFWVDFISNILILSMMACAGIVLVIFHDEPSWWLIPPAIGVYIFFKAEEEFKKIISNKNFEK